MRMNDFMRKSVVLAAIVLLTACSGEFEYNSPYRCFFRFDNKIHQNGMVAAALTPYSNVFVKISKKTSGGVNYVVLSTSDGKKSEEVPITTEIENYANYELGANNGIIVGYDTMNERFVAYDAQCRNCYANSGAYTPNRPLTWTSNSTEVKCDKCGRHYNLNMQGIVSSSEGGERLWQYHVTCTGQYGLLTVTR